MRTALVILALLSLTVALAADAGPVRVAVVTGGHDYEVEQFNAMFAAMEGIEVDFLAHPAASEVYASGGLADYDVLVLYDLYQDISPDQKSGLVGAITGGMGLVSLHHAMADYEAWPRWREIVGGHYWLAPHEVDGETLPISTYQHGVEMDVHIADPDHPITRGLSDFALHDEVYGGFEVSPDVDVLLTSTHELSGPVVGWTHTVGEGRVAYMQPGHDSASYEDENYRTLVLRSILWAAKELN